MKPVTIITGGHALGKTQKALELTQEKKALWLEVNDFNKEDFRKFDVLVYDAFPLFIIEAFEWMAKLVQQEKITYRNPYEREPISIERPEIIFTTQSIPENFPILPHIKIINL